MIGRYLFVVCLFLLQGLSLVGQDYMKDTARNVYYDVDSFPVFRFDSLDSQLIIKYYPLSEVRVSANIRFVGGYDALSAYCDSLYYHREDYNYDELNAKALYTILFDQELKLKEVRIIKRIAYNNLKYNYDDLVKRILLSTEGKWIRSREDKSEWYFYSGFFNLR